MFSVLWYFCPIKPIIGHFILMNEIAITPVLPALPITDLPPRIDIARLQAAMATSRAPSTRRCYSAQWRLWSQWAFSREYDILPALPVCVADYLLDRAEAGASIATLRLVRASIAAIHKDSGHADPTDNPGVKRVMAGLARSLAGPQRQAAGLTRDVQIAIQATAAFPRMLPSGQLESPGKAARRARLDIALVAVMRDGLLRRSGSGQYHLAGRRVSARRNRTTYGQVIENRSRWSWRYTLPEHRDRHCPEPDQASRPGPGCHNFWPIRSSDSSAHRCGRGRSRNSRRLRWALTPGRYGR